MQEQLPRTSATERATDGLEACLRGQVPRVAADRLAPPQKNQSATFSSALNPTCPHTEL
jgi:hypothetical protein